MCLDYEGGSWIPISKEISADLETVCSSSDVVQVGTGTWWYAGHILSWNSDVVTVLTKVQGENTYGLQDQNVRQLGTEMVCTSIKPGMHVHHSGCSYNIKIVFLDILWFYQNLS